jgi:hypothetical protein
MNLKLVSIPAVVLAASTLAAPAFAERRGGTPHESRQSESRGQVQRAQPRPEAPRAQQPRQAVARPAPRAEVVAPRVVQAPRAVPRAETTPRAYAGGYAIPRANANGTPRAYAGGYAIPRTNGTPTYAGGYAVPRTAPRYNGYYNANHYYYYGSRYYPAPWHGWYGYAPYHPYYFRPWYSIGFGVSLGYPVPYYAYPYPVPVYGYGAPYDTVSVGPNNASYGGIALQITPNDAAVYVDGTYAGMAADFDGSRQPLTLMPGSHHVEITQNGFQPLVFDVTVQPGMVTPYQGALQPEER